MCVKHNEYKSVNYTLETRSPSREGGVPFKATAVVVFAAGIE